MNKENRIAAYLELEKFYNTLGFSNELAAAQYIAYSEYGPSKDITQNNHSTTISNPVSVECESVIARLNHEPNACALVFCSAKNPGGGVLRGSVAQEEEISLCSSWYFQVKDNKEFYLTAGSSAMNTSNMLYNPKALLFKDEHHNDLQEPKSVSFIGMCAPNLNGLKNQNAKITEQEVYEELTKRISFLFNFAQNRKLPTLILGAWGCGVFGLDPKTVAHIFKKEIAKKIYEGKIVFSIHDAQTANIFKAELENTPTISAIKNKKI